MRAEVVPADEAHVAIIAAGMRQADRDEIWAASHVAPEAALRQGLRTSTIAWAGLIDGEPVCLFGVSPLSIVSGDGVPWMLGTEAVVRHQRTFLRHCRSCVDRMRAVYPTLTNYVDDRNTASKRWLRWLGFEIDEPAPYGVEGRMFRRFQMGA